MPEAGERPLVAQGPHDAALGQTSVVTIMHPGEHINPGDAEAAAFFDWLVDEDRAAEHALDLAAPFVTVLALDADAAGQAATERLLGVEWDRRQPVGAVEIRERVEEYDRYLLAGFPDEMCAVWVARRASLVQRLQPQELRPATRREFREPLLDMLTLAGRYTELKRRGRQWWGRCPVHAEQTPSFSVDAEKNVFYCWGACRRGGSPRAFLEWMGVPA